MAQELKKFKLQSMLSLKTLNFEPCCRGSFEDVRHNRHLPMLSSIIYTWTNVAISETLCQNNAEHG